MKRFQAQHALMLLPLGFLLALVLLPLGRLLLLGAGGLSLDLLADGYLRWRLIWSLEQALLTCVLSLLLGMPVAWVLARFAFPGRTLLRKVILLPFVMPTLVGALGVLALFGPHGVLGLDLQESPWLLLYGNLFFNLPLLVRFAQDGFSLVPASRLAAARTLGASPWRVFWRIELPAALPFACSALCLVFLYCFSGFGLALVLGGQHYATIEVEIYTLVANEMNFHDAAALALVSFFLTGCCALAYAWLERSLARPLQGRQQPLLRVRGLRQRAMLLLVLLIILLFSLAPLLAIIWRAVTAGSAAWLALLDDDTLRALGNTARFTGLTLLAALLLLYPSLSASLVMLLGAYALLAYPFVARALASALDGVDPHLPAAASTLGATPWRCAWRVWLPQVMPSLRRGMVFAAASAMGEFAVTLFLSRPEWTTLTTLIYQHMGRPGEKNLDAAMVLSCVLMLLALLAFALIEWPESRRMEC